MQLVALVVNKHVRSRALAYFLVRFLMHLTVALDYFILSNLSRTHTHMQRKSTDLNSFGLFASFPSLLFQPENYSTLNYPHKRVLYRLFFCTKILYILSLYIFSYLVYINIVSSPLFYHLRTDFYSSYSFTSILDTSTQRSQYIYILGCCCSFTIDPHTFLLHSIQFNPFTLDIILQNSYS